MATTLRSASVSASKRLLPLSLAIVLVSYAPPPDPLPSWNEGSAKQGIIEFVRAVTTPGTPSFVPPVERIAVFDNDGTLWVEHPMYTEVMFMIDQVKVAAPKHPEWKGNPVFEALAAHDHKALAELGEKKILQFLGEANAGMSVDTYNKSIRDWLASARQPRFKRPYSELTYKPMQELLAFLRANEFKTFIVSGGTAEFMRQWAEKTYGVTSDQVVGSATEVKFEQNGGSTLIRGAKIAFVDDGPGKPVGIYREIGHRPIAAFGNSDGDQQMLEYAAGSPGKSLMLLVQHDDAVREYAYDRHTKVGKLDKALDEAKAKNWIVVSMKRDWKRIFAFE